MRPPPKRAKTKRPCGECRAIPPERRNIAPAVELRRLANKAPLPSRNVGVNPKEEAAWDSLFDGELVASPARGGRPRRTRTQNDRGGRWLRRRTRAARPPPKRAKTKRPCGECRAIPPERRNIAPAVELRRLANKAPLPSRIVV